MKRIGKVYCLISEPDNIRLAFWKAAKGKHDRKGVVAFRNSLERNIQGLTNQLSERRVNLGHYHFFYVFDPKKRLICAASFPERVLHHAIMNVCEPVLEAYAIHDSYACRKGKGTRKALARTQIFSRTHLWYLKLDIKRYFDSIDHEVLMCLLERQFKEKCLLNLFRQMLETYSTEPGKGLPIGNLISQHLANFYLGFFDHWIKEVRRINAYVRYMDDFVLWSAEKAILKEELQVISMFLNRKLKLQLKMNIQLNRCSWGIPFLGYRVYSHRIRLIPRSKCRFVRKFKKFEQNFVNGKWSQETLRQHMEPLLEFTRVADAARFRQNVINRYGVPS